MSGFDTSAGMSSISGMQSGATAGLNKSDAVTSQRQSALTRRGGAGHLPNAGYNFSNAANNVTYRPTAGNSILVRFLNGAMNDSLGQDPDLYVA